MSKEKGLAHIIILFTILSVIIALILIFLWLQASRALNLNPTQQSQYKNPFSEATKYQNPFETYQNPFDDIKQ
ncbi:MAG: hypothetical protein AAB414_03715 [Patescibacteria group bacterium]